LQDDDDDEEEDEDEAMPQEQQQRTRQQSKQKLPSIAKALDDAAATALASGKKQQQQQQQQPSAQKKGKNKQQPEANGLDTPEATAAGAPCDANKALTRQLPCKAVTLILALHASRRRLCQHSVQGVSAYHAACSAFHHQHGGHYPEVCWCKQGQRPRRLRAAGARACGASRTGSSSRMSP